MRKPGAFGRLLQMKPFLDLEQPFDAHAPGEVAGPFEANDPSVGRNNRVGPARSPVGTEEFFRIGGVALEIGRASCRERVGQDGSIWVFARSLKKKNVIKQRTATTRNKNKNIKRQQ